MWLYWGNLQVIAEYLSLIVQRDVPGYEINNHRWKMSGAHAGVCRRLLPMLDVFGVFPRHSRMYVTASSEKHEVTWPLALWLPAHPRKGGSHHEPQPVMSSSLITVVAVLGYINPYEAHMLTSSLRCLCSFDQVTFDQASCSVCIYHNR